MSKAQRPSHHEATHHGSSGTEQPEPSERLKQLQIELTQHNLRIDHLSKQRDNLQTDLTDLKTSMDDVKAVLSNYAGALQDLESRVQSLQYFFEQKLKMVEGAIGHRKDGIEELISEFQREVDRMKKRLDELRERRGAAQDESANAAKAEATVQSQYDTLSQYQQTVNSKLKDMEDLRSQIMLADSINDTPSMYFLVLELKNALRDAEIMSQHELAKELRHNIIELEAAKEHARSKNADYSALDLEYTQHAATLKSKMTDRRTSLLAEIEKKYPVKAASTRASASTGEGASASGTSGTPAPGPTTMQKT